MVEKQYQFLNLVHLDFEGTLVPSLFLLGVGPFVFQLHTLQSAENCTLSHSVF